MTLEPPLSHEIVAFWRDAGPDRWFDDDPAFDADIRSRFETAHMAAAAAPTRPGRRNRSPPWRW